MDDSHARARDLHGARERGFTLVEVLVTISIMSVLCALAIGAWRSWTLSQNQKGGADAVETILRETQMRAVTEGVSFCVNFDVADGTYTVSRYACDDSPQQVAGPYQFNDPRIHFTSVAFTAPDGSAWTAVTFRPSGSAWPGSLSIIRDGSSKTYTLNVEGFTGRVSGNF